MCPQQLASVNVKSAYVTLDVISVRRAHAHLVGCTNYQYIVDDQRREGQGNVSIVAHITEAHAIHQVQNATICEGLQRQASAGVQCGQVIARRDHKNDFLITICPVGNTFA